VTEMKKIYEHTVGKDWRYWRSNQKQ